MKYKALSLPLLFCLFYQFSPLAPIYAEDTASVETFSPKGTVKSVRQVSVRFSEQMVPLGDPRLVEPFEINCQEKGRGRWADGRNWIYDFDRDIPAGIICEFKVKEGLKTLSGKEITGQRAFLFSTGGPAIMQSNPWEGCEYIDEDQIFILTLDAEPDEKSVLSNVSFSIEGIKERVGARIIKGEERERLLKNIRRDDRFKDMPVIVLQCRQRFPNNARVNLIWGEGVASLSGVPTAEDQVLPFRAREPFAVSFSCERENPRANCIPMLPMTLGFSAPVSWEYAGKIVMKGADGKIYKPSKPNGEEKSEFVGVVIFQGPFPENSTFVIEMPKDIKDDAGRSLSNINSFPLTVKTDSYPPLAKFSSRFGIIELNGDAALPVTLRNLEPRVKSRILDVGEEVPEEKEEGVSGSLKKGAAKIGEIFSPMLSGEMKEKLDTLKGRSRKVFKDEEIIDWLKKVAGAGRRSSILTGAKGSTDFYAPKPSGARAFEVVGIPLKDPGLYVVEMESLILGSSLLGVPKPMYVPTAALVTNLSAHFKWGRESSLVWVTTLNKGEPVKDAAITIRDCEKKVIWQGKTDAKGIAYVNSQLPMPESLPYCQIKWEEDHYYDSSQSDALNGIRSGLFVFAKTQDDLTFVHSNWDNGIEPWRFSLPYESYKDAVMAHTVFDRTLLRAGETVSMKHIIRRHVMEGFSLIKGEELPKAVLIQHRGSNQRYEFPLKWDGSGIAETTWAIPREAKLGTYKVTLLKKATDKPKERTAVGGYEEGDEGYFYPDGWPSGSFRVEEFRVPLMKGIIQPPKEPLIKASEAQVDLFVKYLSGGGAGGAAVKLRSQVQPRYVNFDDYEGFVFANGEVKEETVRTSSGEEWYGETEQGRREKPKVQSSDLVLDPSGALRTKITDLPKVTAPQDIQAELEFRDPNGEVQTVSARIPLWPSRLLVGIKPDAWASSKEAFKFHVAVVNTAGRPVKDSEVKVDLFERKYYSHRKRLVGGFYSYEHVTETKRIGALCEGKTNQKGVLTCEVQSPVSGNVILQATTTDDSGNISAAFRDVWIAGKGEWWFDVTDNDRIDILPEKKRYEPGETARFQVRMPFREATALVTVEREGVMERFVKRLSGKNPTIDLPVRSNYAPNVFVSVLCVRGRVSGVQPTSLVDLGKPAYKLGIAEIKVGWKPHELKVKVASDRSVYKIREKARVKVSVKKADGTLPPKGSEVAIAAVDEGLLELMPNNSWKLLDAMMGRRGYEVRTATAQMQVVGKRHYGLKALPHGGGGGRQTTREMFDTLLLWKGRVFLDEKGEATVEIPLNDSLTSFKIVAVASGGVGLFGTGETSIRTTQDLMLLSGLPQMVREGDRFRGGFTIRNASDRKMDVEVTATLSIDNPLEKIVETLAPGEAKEVGWDVTVPVGIDSLTWQVSVKEKDGAGSDSMKVRQKVAAAVPVRTFLATITQVDKPVTMKVEKPTDALPSKGGVNVSLRSKLSNGLGGVTYFMKNYPYTCMEQKVSRAVALRDEELWKKGMAELPSHMDSDGLIKYFPTCIWGSDTLTAYILAIANEAGWEIPEAVRARMEEGLIGFINGRVIRWSSLPTADVSIRKMAALEALSRYGKGDPGLLGSITLEPNLWPTSAVIDWMNVLMRVKTVPDRQKRLSEAEQIIRSRLNFQGTTMGFSTEGMDSLWWLMVSTDVNSVRAILTLLDMDLWKEDMPRLVRGALGRQYHGAWNLTTANAWGVLAMEKFSSKFESVPVTGATSAALEGKTKSVDWGKTPSGGSVAFGWPKGKEDISISHQGTGRPWATIQSLAAIPLKEPFSSGYKIKKSLTPVEQKKKGKWSKGDVVRVRLDLESQADMTWVVVNDPVPAGSSILGTGLGRDSQILTGDEKSEGWVWPAFEERSFEAFRAYYEFVPKGKWTVEYTVRLNNEGTFNLPETRVEALYAPEMFGEIPNRKVEVER